MNKAETSATNPAGRGKGHGLRSLIVAAGLLWIFTVSAAAEDTRTAIDLPPDVKVQFLEHMRTHMISLNDVIQLMSNGKIREAGALARKEMAIGKGMGFGRFMPPRVQGNRLRVSSVGGRFRRCHGRSSRAAGCRRLVQGDERPCANHDAVQRLPRRLPGQVRGPVRWPFPVSAPVSRRRELPG